ncbi:hypothetical protein ACGFI9_02955 [Micromonospora sp. NPDC048930]|uniref:hypothetical protein n=1 Tax=Micromonospora sp. NPDC048930 TaxID=3364261 RepID=UPI003724A05D
MNGVLRDVLDERAGDVAEESGDPARLAAVHRRIARLRRRRIAAAGTAVAVVALAVGVGAAAEVRPSIRKPPAGALPAATPTPSPSPSARTIAGFPEYLDGGRVRWATSAPASEMTVSLTFVPTTTNLMIWTRCDPPEILAQVEAPSGALLGGECGGSHRLRARSLADLGIKVGRPVTLRLNVDGTMPRPGEPRQTAPPANGTIALAAGEAVPFAAYPLPPRPATLPPLPTSDTGTTIRSAPDDPLAPQSVAVSRRQRLTFLAQSQTPGTLRVLADGREITTCVKWDYAPTATRPSRAEIDNGCYEEFLPGDLDRPTKRDSVTITVQPQHVAGDWAVRVF